MLVDANVLLYARDASSPFHERARSWLTEHLNGPVRVGLPWACSWPSFASAPTPRAFEHPLTPADAWAQVEEWLAAPAAWVPEATHAHGQVLGALIRRYELRGNLITDAHLAALAIEHGLTMCSADTDFARFSELRWVDPTAS